MRTIIYATDYSENSLAALNYAYKMSVQMETRLVVTHVFDYPTILGSEMLSEPFPQLEKGAYKTHQVKLEEFCTVHLGNEWKTPNIKLEVVENKSVIKGIISVADEWHAYLVVIGMKGGSALQEIIMGSTTKHLIEKVPYLILAIPADTSYMPIKTIVYATDFEKEDVDAINILTEIAKPFKARIKIVHISPEKEFAGKEQMEWFKEMLKEKVSYKEIEFEILFSDDIFDSLRIYLGLENIGADLVAMMERKKRGLIKKWFHHDLVKKMESYGQIPLLSFNKMNYELFNF